MPVVVSTAVDRRQLPIEASSSFNAAPSNFIIGRLLEIQISLWRNSKNLRELLDVAGVVGEGRRHRGLAVRLHCHLAHAADGDLFALLAGHLALDGGVADVGGGVAKVDRVP